MTAEERKQFLDLCEEAFAHRGDSETWDFFHKQLKEIRAEKPLEEVILIHDQRSIEGIFSDKQKAIEWYAQHFEITVEQAEQFLSADGYPYIEIVKLNQQLHK